MEIKAAAVKELREKTGLGMMDCKKALVASDGDMQAALENLRKAGVAKAAKKSGRTVREGCIVACIEDGTGVLAEVLSETDFVAKNEKFREFANALAARTVRESAGDWDVSDAVIDRERDALTELVGVIGENLQIRRVVRWETDGNLASYLHMGGKIGVLLDADRDAEPGLLNDVCMHIAAFSPQYITPEDVPEEVVAKEREIAAAQVADKPAQIIDKIVTGKLNKWYSEVCLTRQPWIRDDKTSLAKKAPELKLHRFLRWQVGEEL